MKEFIPVNYREDGATVIYGSDILSFFAKDPDRPVKTVLRKWVPRMIEDCLLVEGQDFRKVAKFGHLSKPNQQQLDWEFTADNDPLIFDKGGNLTMYGFKNIVTTLCGAISEYSRAIKAIGGSEGEVIKDAINQLKSNLVKSDREPPKAKTVMRRKRHNPRDKSAGW